MVRFLVFIKHNFSFIWTFVEFINSWIFHLLFGNLKNRTLSEVLPKFNNGFEYRLICENDLNNLVCFFRRQPESYYKYFKPHGFDINSLKKKFNDHSFLMFGVFHGDVIVGYFFLRCFFNKKAFRGKIVDCNYQGQGISKYMAIITTSVCVKMRFRQFSTVSKNNIASLLSTKSVNRIKILKELSDNYIFIECFPKD